MAGARPWLRRQYDTAHERLALAEQQSKSAHRRSNTEDAFRQCLALRIWRDVAREGRRWPIAGTLPILPWGAGHGHGIRRCAIHFTRS